MTSRVELPAGPLVSTEWLAARLGEAEPEARARAEREGGRGLVVVDVRGKVMPPGSKPRYLPKREEYVASHVPGAVFVDWTRDIVDLADPVPVQVAPPEDFARAMQERGIGDETAVVAYDDYDHIFAGRLAWALRYYGHDAVRVLDGGWTRWTSEGRPTTSETTQVTPARFTPRPHATLRRTADEVAASLGKPGVLLIDARSPDQYAGTQSAASRGGHIPGAVNVHYAKLVDAATGRFLAAPELARVFAAAGVDVAKLPGEVVVYCNGGVSCTVPMHALQLLGRQDVAVYDGSWNEWGNDPARPARTGGEP